MKSTKIFLGALAVAMSVSAAPNSASAASVSEDIADFLPEGLRTACERLGCDYMITDDGENAVMMNGDFRALDKAVRRGMMKRWKNRFVDVRDIDSAAEFRQKRRQWRGFRSKRIDRWSEASAELVLFGSDSFMTGVSSSTDSAPGTPPPAVPVPAAGPLLLGGLFALAALRRRRRKAW